MIDLLFFSKDYCHFCLNNLADNFICEDCKERLVYVNGKKELCNGICYYPLFYNNYIKEIIKRFKYKSDTYLIKPLAGILYKFINDKNIEFDYISYIPMYHKDEFERGYNQSKILAEILSDLTGKKLIKIIEKIRSTKHQNKLTKLERLNNLETVFEAIKLEELRNKKLLIIDDLVTTGSTFNTVSNEIKKLNDIEFIFLAITSSKLEEEDIYD